MKSQRERLEQGVLGSMMMDNGNFPMAMEQMFRTEFHRKVFRTIQEAKAKFSGGCDPILVHSLMLKSDWLAFALLEMVREIQPDARHDEVMGALAEDHWLG